MDKCLGSLLSVRFHQLFLTMKLDRNLKPLAWIATRLGFLGTHLLVCTTLIFQEGFEQLNS